MVEILYILSAVVVTRLYMFVKIHMPIYLKRMNFIICKLCFNYLVKERKGGREERSKPTGHFLVPDSINQKKKTHFFETIKNQGNLNTAWWYFKNYCSYLLYVIIVLRLKKVLLEIHTEVLQMKLCLRFILKQYIWEGMDKNVLIITEPGW